MLVMCGDISGDGERDFIGESLKRGFLIAFSADEKVCTSARLMAPLIRRSVAFFFMLCFLGTVCSVAG